MTANDEMPQWIVLLLTRDIQFGALIGDFVPDTFDRTPVYLVCATHPTHLARQLEPCLDTLAERAGSVR